MAIDATTLRLRYPAFATVADDTIAYWLTDAARIVTEAWGEDQEPGTLALAAHSMAIGGVVTGQGAQLPAGVTSFRSGAFAVTVDASAAAQSASGGYSATRYGQEFAVMLRRNVGTVMLVGYGDVC